MHYFAIAFLCINFYTVHLAEQHTENVKWTSHAFYLAGVLSVNWFIRAHKVKEAIDKNLMSWNPKLFDLIETDSMNSRLDALPSIRIIALQVTYI